MRHISLKVSGLSKCILLHEYQSTTDGRIIAKRSSWLCQSLVLASKSHRVSQDNYNHEIKIEVEDDIVIGSNLINVGLYMHTYHLDKAMSWIYASVKAGAKAADGIYNLYREYNIDDNDYSMETMRRKWQRFWYKLENNLNDGPIRRKLSLPYKKSTPKAIEFEPKEMDNVMSKIFAENLRYFCLTANRYNRRLFLSMRIYTLYQLKYSNLQIAAIVKMSTANVSYHRNQWRNLLDTQPTLAESYHKIISPWLASLSHERALVCK